MREVAGRIPENSRKLVNAIIQQVLGCQPDSIEHLKGLGMNNSVTVAKTPQGSFVVRTNVESHLKNFEKEAWCFEQLASTPVPTPKVIGCGILDGHSYSVAPFLTNSSPITPELDQLRVWKILGSYAQHLNKIAAPKDADLAAKYFSMSWEQQVKEDVDLIFTGKFWLDQGLMTEGQQDKVKQYLLGCANNAIPQGVCQFDLTIANAVICNFDYDQIFLLDLEVANIAPVPYYQFGCLAAERGPESEDTKAFFEGYGFDSQQLQIMAPELTRFTLYRLMRGTAWARDRYPPLLAMNIERTMPVLAECLNSDLC